MRLLGTVLGVAFLALASCSSSTGPTSSVEGVWLRGIGHDDGEFLVLQQRGQDISGWFCTTFSNQSRAAVAGVAPGFTWVHPLYGTVRGEIGTPDLVVKYSPTVVVQFTRVTLGPPAACLP
jgi:hypothetical protein